MITILWVIIWLFFVALVLQVRHHGVYRAKATRLINKIIDDNTNVRDKIKGMVQDLELIQKMRRQEAQTIARLLVQLEQARERDVDQLMTICQSKIAVERAREHLEMVYRYRNVVPSQKMQDKYYQLLRDDIANAYKIYHPDGPETTTPGN